MMSIIIHSRLFRCWSWLSASRAGQILSKWRHHIKYLSYQYFSHWIDWTNWQLIDNSNNCECKAKPQRRIQNFLSQFHPSPHSLGYLWSSLLCRNELNIFNSFISNIPLQLVFQVLGWYLWTIISRCQRNGVDMWQFSGIWQHTLTS